MTPSLLQGTSSSLNKHHHYVVLNVIEWVDFRGDRSCPPPSPQLRSRLQWGPDHLLVIQAAFGRRSRGGLCAFSPVLDHKRHMKKKNGTSLEPPAKEPGATSGPAAKPHAPDRPGEAVSSGSFCKQATETFSQGVRTDFLSSGRAT